MGIKKSQSFIFLILILLTVIICRQTVFAQDTSDSQTAQTRDIFEFEHEGQILEYQITQLKSDTTLGTVTAIRVKNNTNISGELHLPETVIYLDIPYSVTRIGMEAFRDSTNMTNAVIPAGIVSIGYGAFYNCSLLTEVNIPDTVTFIDPHAFTGCNNLKSINLPKGVTVISSGTFQNCTSLENISIPEGVTTIDYYAFQNCKKLQNIQLPRTVTKIETNAFLGTNIIYNTVKGSYAADFCKANRFPCIYTLASGELDTALEEIIFHPMVVKLHPGETSKLNLLSYPYNVAGSRQAVWYDSNTKTATINSEGAVTALNPGTTTITATIGEVQAECTVIVSPETPKAVKAVASGIDSIKLSWKPMKEARNYFIYRSTSKYNGYELIKSVTGSSYNDIRLKQDAMYYYKICSSISAINYSAKSYYSKIVNTKPSIAVPQPAAASVSNNNIKVFWNEVKGAKGYIIYRSFKKGASGKYYKSIIHPYFTDTSLTRGKSYYYSVKAYYLKKDKKIYSSTSNTVSAVAKTPTTPKYVTISTSLSDVYKILGTPHRKYFYDGYWELYYTKNSMTSNVQTAIIYLKKIAGEYEVIGWYNLYTGIKVSDGEEKNTGTFTLGSSIKEVARAMETPHNYELDYSGTYGDVIIKNSELEYSDGSTITFNSDLRVIGWENKGCLKVKYGADKPTCSQITLGTSMTDILTSLGTPDRVRPYDSDVPAYLFYGSTILTINWRGELAGWENRKDMNITLGQKNPTGPDYQLGSTLNDVVNVMGTPDYFNANPNYVDSLNSICYGNTVIYFNEEGKVSRIQSK